MVNREDQMTVDKDTQDVIDHIRHIQSSPNITDEQLREYYKEVMALKSTVPNEHGEYPNLAVGQRVKVHTGEEGVIAGINNDKAKRYHVLFSACFGGQYGAWEVTPVEE
jgi:hypothetical protein